MNPIDADLMILEYCKCRKNMTMFIYWPTLSKKISLTEMSKIIEKYGNICHTKTISMSKIMLYNLMFWIYNTFTFNYRLEFIDKHPDYVHSSDENEVNIIYFDDNKTPTDVILGDILKTFQLKDSMSLYITNDHSRVILNSSLILNDNSLQMLEYQNIDNITS